MYVLLTRKKLSYHKIDGVDHSLIFRQGKAIIDGRDIFPDFRFASTGEVLQRNQSGEWVKHPDYIGRRFIHVCEVNLKLRTLAMTG